MKKWLKLVFIDLAACLLGALLTLAFAPYGIFPFAILSLAGLMILIQHANPSRAAWLGFLFGLGYFGTGVYWVFISIHNVGGVPTPISLLITGGMIAFLSLYPAAACYFTNRFFPKQPNTANLFAFPAIWCITELARAWLFSGFPWLLVGYSQTNSPLSGYAPLIGVYGVSLAVLFTSSLLVSLINRLRERHYQSAYFTLFAMTFIFIAGSLFSLITWTTPTGKSTSVSLVQGNIPQEMKWSPEHLQLSYDTYVNLTRPLWGKSDIIIWPEAAIPVPLQYTRSFIESMNDKAVDSGSHLILGIPIKSAYNSGFNNAVITLGKDKNVYLKRRLVPFGEYSPFAGSRFEKIFKLINLPLPESTPGNLDQKPMTINNIKILTAICYEIAFPELMNSGDRDVGLILTVTNDAWFGRSAAQAQHLQMAEMRSQELRRPGLFVSNDGITAILSPKGTIEAAAPAHETFVLSGTVTPMVGMTPWMRNGTDPFAVLLICMLAASFKAKRKHKLQVQPETVL